MKTKSKSRFNGEGSFYFDKSKNRWYGVVTVGYTADEKPIRKKISDKDFKNAQKKFNELKAQIESGSFIEKNNSLLRDIISSQIEKKRALNLIKISSYNREIKTLNIIANDSIGKMPIQTISERDILIFFNKNLNRSESYLKKLFRQLNAAFNYAQSENIINKNPMSNVKRPKSTRATKKISALTVEEQRKFVAILNGPEKDNKFTPIFLLMLNTGLRPGEVLALDKDKDLNFNFNRISVRRTLTKDVNDKSCLGETAKTENGIRTIVMSKFCKNHLINFINSWEPNPEHLLFYDYNNKHLISSSQLNSAFKHLIVKYKIINFEKHIVSLSEKTKPVRFKKYTYYKFENGRYELLKSEPLDWKTRQHNYYFSKIEPEKPFNVHMLRHTFATRCIESGMPVKVLSKILGHSDIEITLNTYCDVFENFENDALKQAETYMRDMELIG